MRYAKICCAAIGSVCALVGTELSAFGQCEGEYPTCGTTTESCYEAHGERGCNCKTCCELVCEVFPGCCEIEWDEFCVDDARDLCGSDCDGDGTPDSCDTSDARNADCNGNDVPDGDDGPTFCWSCPGIPVDLIAVVDPSSSNIGELEILCNEVFRGATARLQQDFDVRAAWVSVMNTVPNSDCNDWTMPLGTTVPVCDATPARTIDDPDLDGEEWGDATAVMTAPYGSYPIGADGEPWAERDAVLILIPISDEGAQDGDAGGPCGCDDLASAHNLISQAVLKNAQVIPMPTSGTPECVYDPCISGSHMSLVASETMGSVVDARQGVTEALSATLEEAIRDAIAVSPRIDCSCLGDLSGDGALNGADLTFVLSAWGETGACVPEDLNGDGLVSGADLTLILGNWGPCS